VRQRHAGKKERKKYGKHWYEVRETEGNKYGEYRYEVRKKVGRKEIRRTGTLMKEGKDGKGGRQRKRNQGTTLQVQSWFSVVLLRTLGQKFKRCLQAACNPSTAE
jgi:hypothetical protein